MPADGATAAEGQGSCSRTSLLAAATSSTASTTTSGGERRTTAIEEPAPRCPAPRPNLTHFMSRGDVRRRACSTSEVDRGRHRRGLGRHRRGRRGASTAPTSRRGCATRRPRSRWPRRVPSARSRGMPNLQPDRGADRPPRRLPRDAEVERSPWRSSNDPRQRPSPSRPASARVEHDPLGVFARPRDQDRLAQLGHHRRPQEDRHHVRRLGAVLLRHRRHRGAADPRPAGRARTASSCSADLYNQVFTMHGIDDGLPGRHADRRGVHELPDAAADRRPRRRLPPPERASASGASCSAASS